MNRARQLLINISKENDRLNHSSEFGRSGLDFGGKLLKSSHAKSVRPLDSKTPLHLVVYSSLAKGQKSLLYKSREVENIVCRQAEKSGVKIFEISNGGHHLHLILQTPRQRKFYNSFVRAFTGEIARLMTGARKSKPQMTSPHSKNRSYFWDHKPFSRILSNWDRAFKNLQNHLRKHNGTRKISFNQNESRTLIAQIRDAVKSSKLIATGFS